MQTFLFANTLMLLLMCYELIDGAARWATYKKGGNLIDNRFQAYKAIKNPVTIPDSIKPDIYLLVFDAMPSTIAMKKEWSFDNSNLDSSLSKEGFYINSFSKSNYNLTVLSIASMLNMDYTPPIDIYQDETKMYFKASASILDNSLTRFLLKQEYDIKQYQPVSFNNNDWDNKVFFSDMLCMNYFYQTLPGRMYRDLKWGFLRIKNKLIPSDIFAKVQKQNLQHQADLEKTIQLVKQSCALKKNQPQFVYAHFQLPHDPFIYDSTGKLKPPANTININESDQPSAFLEQVKFADNIILQLVLHIIRNNKKNSIILVAGDHGYRNVHGTRSYMVFDNFSSYYFPDSNYLNLYSSISPVNSFRVVLNKYFNTGLPLLKDSSIFIPYTLPGNE
ncbi:sulfatase-like hydrolase/transferase [Lacibacter luteus]|uniref:sulfatase-like hydrolase/transferase n=1 Tax=Lacibacter luteus TaxID=2508719 RepID=UPI0013E9644D|nr:sulfatase-like hydrolase/transferase [Lacibacter luteus]